MALSVYPLIPYLKIDEAIRLDEQSIRDFGVSGNLLMENAGNEMGRKIWKELLQQNRLATPSTPCEIIFLCGPGNNGGDGLVAARYLLRQCFLIDNFSQDNLLSDLSFKAEVLLTMPVIKIFICAPKEKILSNEILSDKYHLLEGQLLDGKSEMHFVESYEQFLSGVEKKVYRVQLIVDALFGIGLKKSITLSNDSAEDQEAKNFYGRLVKWINIEGREKRNVNRDDNLSIRKVIALDIPSGLNMWDENNKNSLCVEADLTLTVEAYKDIFFYPKHKIFLKQIEIISLDFPVCLKKKYLSFAVLGMSLRASKRNDYEHKLSGGKSLICAGSGDFLGASELAVRGALSMGCGYLISLAPRAVPYDKSTPEIIRLLANSERELQSEDFAIIKDKLAKNVSHGDVKHVGAKKLIVKNILFGPGMGRKSASTDFLKQLLENISIDAKNLRQAETKCRFIIDADGIFHLRCLIERGDFTAAHGHEILLTPHFGEFQSLVAEPITADNFLFTIKKFAINYNIYLLVKDVTSLIYLDRFYFYDKASAFLGKAGSGDILAGMILGASSYAKDFTSGILTALNCYHQRASAIEEKHGSNASITALYDEALKTHRCL